MTRKQWLGLFPSLLVGAGIVASTYIAVLTAPSGWLVLAAPLLLALALVSASALDSRLGGESAGPSPAALILAGAILLAGVIVTLRDPALIMTFIPVIGVATWVPLLLRTGGGRKACGAN